MGKPGRIFTVVLTGGIASGKTAVSECFSRLGAAVLDTDLIARKMVEPGQPALNRIAHEFGEDYLGPDGRLNRRKMRGAIFSDAEKRARLEDILHPLIEKEAMRLIDELAAPYCILVIPLYAESSRFAWIDRVLVVDVDEETQLERVMARDHISREQARAILQAQASRAARLKLADDVLENRGSLAELGAKVKDLHVKYLTLAQ